MFPSIHPLLSIIAAFCPVILLIPSESTAEERRPWEGSIVLARDSSPSGSRSYKRYLREQRKLERQLEREQIRETRRIARNRYSRGSDYYPYYRSHKNPVVSTDEYYEEGYAPDGTYHSQEVIEDRHQSYYSPGRQEAITPPNTTVDTWTYGDGTTKSREKTTWIGRDGQYHSTTINRTMRVDDEGNSHTSTHVDLKRQAASFCAKNSTSSSSAPEAKPSSPKTETLSTISSNSSAQASAQASSQASPAVSKSSSSSSSKSELKPKPTETESTAEAPSTSSEASQ